jgi:hypothetical protein
MDLVMEIFFQKKKLLISVGNLDPVDVATQNIFRLTIEDAIGTRPKKNPITNQTRSKPKLNDRFEIFWVATRSKILYCFHQAVYPGKFSEKCLGQYPENFSGRDRFSNFLVATGSGRWSQTQHLI